MIKVDIRKYRTKKNQNLKKGIFITFLNPLLKETVSKVGSKLKSLLDKEFDSLIVLLQDEYLGPRAEILNPYAIQLILAISKSSHRPVGIIWGEKAKELFHFTNLGKFFVTGESVQSVLMKMEDLG